MNEGLAPVLRLFMGMCDGVCEKKKAKKTLNIIKVLDNYHWYRSWFIHLIFSLPPKFYDK